MRALRSLAVCLGAIALWGMLLGGGAGLPGSASSAVAVNSPRLDTSTLHAVPAAALLPSGRPPAVADVRPSGTAEGGDPTGESSSPLVSARRSASVLGQALSSGRMIARAERTCAMLCVFLC
ncbi:MAG: hypothetical protein V5A22_09850 [Salinivenus sp.]